MLIYIQCFYILAYNLFSFNVSAPSVYANIVCPLKNSVYMKYSRDTK